MYLDEIPQHGDSGRYPHKLISCRSDQVAIIRMTRLCNVQRLLKTVKVTILVEIFSVFYYYYFGLKQQLLVHVRR